MFQAHQEIRDLNANLIKLEQVARERAATLKLLEDEMKAAGIEKSSSQLLAENQQLKVEQQEIQTKFRELEILKEKKLKEEANAIKISPLDPKEKKVIEKDYEKYLAAYKKRKAICREMIDQIMESYPGSKKKLMDENDIVTDEDANFVLEQIP